AGPFDHLIAGFLLAPEVVWRSAFGTQKAYSAGIGRLWAMPSTLTVSFFIAAASAPPPRSSAAIPPRRVEIHAICRPMRAMTSSAILLLSMCLRHAPAAVNRRQERVHHNIMRTGRPVPRRRLA